jgi:hypothetical protein
MLVVDDGDGRGMVSLLLRGEGRNLSLIERGYGSVVGRLECCMLMMALG